MGIYSTYIFPKVINVVMSTGYMKKARSAALAQVTGEVFEIGFGTGLNLPFYPEGIKKITTADVNPAMGRHAQKNIDASPIEVDCRTLNGESLPMEDETFDSVVCTWTLCSIVNVEQALREVHRVLKPDGKFFFVEHGLADDPKIQRWQDRLTPPWKMIGDGCHLNRNMKELIQDQHFAFQEIETYYMEKSPRAMGFMYQGIAAKA